MKVNRYEKARKLLSIVRQGCTSNVLFIDEKMFTVNSTCNSQNSKRSGKVSVNSRSHFPSSVMNWTIQQDWAPAHGAKTTFELC
uniref:DDE_Tnp_ISL3 domain-containing protein n=1 Tax=Heterorhabditis bacteriophora TaxID=37862 RepID=A0A1I7WCU1_HETBA